MRILVTFCLVASFYFTFGQNTDLSQSYALHSYSEVPINWKMDGKLQVFLNEGINFLIEGNPEAALSNLEEFVEKDSSFWITTREFATGHSVDTQKQKKIYFAQIL
jgi:hypothetical protein